MTDDDPDTTDEYPVRQTVQNRIQRLALAGHLQNKYDTGSYEFVDDPREGWAARGKRRG